VNDEVDATIVGLVGGDVTLSASISCEEGGGTSAKGVMTAPCSSGPVENGEVGSDAVLKNGFSI